MQYRTILGCAMYVDILKPASLLSLSLQESELDMVLGIKNILKSTTALKSLARQDPFEWPTVKLLLRRMKDKGGEKSYQGAALQNVSPATQESLKQDALHYLNREGERTTDIKLLWSLLIFLETQSVPVSVPSLSVKTKTRLMTMAMTAAA